MPGPRREALFLGLKLGLLGFGGPAAHAAMLQDEVCERRRWMTREAFLDALGAVNIIPGPNSSELVLLVGRLRAGTAGLLLAGLGFIAPAMLLTGALAWAYVKYGALPAAGALLAGIKPAVLAVILAAIWRLARPAVRDWRLAFVGAAVLVVGYARGQEILALALGSVVGTVWRMRAEPGLLGVAAIGAVPEAGRSAILAKLFGFFLVVGSILYGSGYVLIAFLEGTLVRHWGWLSRRELLDAVAAGQVTPGPLLTTATFVGYLVGARRAPGLAVPAALLATAGVFLPSFLLVAILGRHLPRLRRARWASCFLDAVNVSALGLMAAVLLKLGRAALWPGAGFDARAAIVALAAAAAVFVLRLNIVWIVLGGALLGFGLARL
jgi:chromate transporter